jgi:hypothetical protein
MSGSPALKLILIVLLKENYHEIPELHPDVFAVQQYYEIPDISACLP